jgi:hypothetical protein
LFKRRQVAYRIVAVVLVALVLSFAFQAAGHWHTQFEDQHCRVCHFAHSVTVDLSDGTTLPIPQAVARLNPAKSVDPQLELVFHQTSSRAPPSQS